MAAIPAAAGQPVTAEVLCPTLRAEAEVSATVPSALRCAGSGVLLELDPPACGVRWLETSRARGLHHGTDWLAALLERYGTPVVGVAGSLLAAADALLVDLACADFPGWRDVPGWLLLCRGCPGVRLPVRLGRWVGRAVVGRDVVGVVGRTVGRPVSLGIVTGGVVDSVGGSEVGGVVGGSVVGGSVVGGSVVGGSVVGGSVGGDDGSLGLIEVLVGSGEVAVGLAEVSVGSGEVCVGLTELPVGVGVSASAGAAKPTSCQVRTVPAAAAAAVRPTLVRRLFVSLLDSIVPTMDRLWCTSMGLLSRNGPRTNHFPDAGACQTPVRQNPDTAPAAALQRALSACVRKVTSRPRPTTKRVGRITQSSTF